MLCSFCCDTIYALVLTFYTACGGGVRGRGGWGERSGGGGVRGRGGGVRGRGYSHVFTICMRETCTRSESCFKWRVC